MPRHGKNSKGVAIPYSGPTRLVKGGAAKSLKVRLSSTIAAATGAGTTMGLIQGSNTAGTNGVALTSATQYSSYAARFTEMRVLSVQVSYVPNNVIQDATHAGGSGAAAINRNPTAGNLTNTVSGIYASQGSKTIHAFKPWKISCKAVDLEDLLFTAPNVNADTFAVQSVFAGLTTGTTYGTYYIDWVVEFRSEQ